MKIRKAVIAAAGFGTRFLPATKVIPKEMLPLVDRPIIQVLVEELVASEIKEVIIVTRPGAFLTKIFRKRSPVKVIWAGGDGGRRTDFGVFLA